MASHIKFSLRSPTTTFMQESIFVKFRQHNFVGFRFLLKHRAHGRDGYFSPADYFSVDAI